jgi:tryptophan-rich sensory protein
VADSEPAKPGIGFWLAIAASAIAGTVNMLTRPDFEPGDLIVPTIFTAILVGTLMSVRVFWPQALGNVDRNGGLLIGFMIGMLTVILLFGANDLR